MLANRPDVRSLATICQMEKVRLECDGSNGTMLYSLTDKGTNGPSLHVVQGMSQYLRFLATEDAVPVICLADWRFEKWQFTAAEMAGEQR